MPSVPSSTTLIPEPPSAPRSVADGLSGSQGVSGHQRARMARRARAFVTVALMAALAGCGGGGGGGGSGASSTASTGEPQAGTGSSQVKSVMAVSQTRDNTLVVDGAGVLWARGSNLGGALGIGSTTGDVLNLISKESDDVKPEPRAYVRISSSETHSLALTDEGQLWGWGDNSSGQLGTGQKMHHRAVLLASDVVALAAASDHSLYVTRNGKLYAMGSNHHGQLGTGDTDDRASAVPIGSGFSKVATGLRFSAAVKQDGTLWTWGNGERGELGDGRSGRSVSVLEPTQIDAGYAEVFAGSERAFALRASDGELVGWGDNMLGQLGIGSKGNFMTVLTSLGAGYSQVWAGAGHTIARRTDGSLQGWGSNVFDQLGLGRAIPEALTPMSIPGDYDFVSAGGGNTLFATRSGQLVARGASFPNASIDFPYDPDAGREVTDPARGAGSGSASGGAGTGGGSSGGASASGGNSGSSGDALAYPEIAFHYQCRPVGGVVNGGTVPVSNGPCLSEQKAYSNALACNEVGPDYSFNHVGKPYYQCLVSNSTGSYKSGYQQYLDYYSR